MANRYKRKFPNGDAATCNIVSARQDSFMIEQTRREALLTFLAAAAAGLVPASLACAAEADDLVFAEPQPFSFDALKARAEAEARMPYSDPVSPFADTLEKIDYDAFQKIVFDKDKALWADGLGGAPVQLFHLGRFFKQPTAISVVENGQAREILYRRSYFDMPADHVAQGLPDNIGFSGFRIEAPDQKTDWMAFLGASYFRSSGELDQYGLSARGVAIDTAMPHPEEFPRFTDFWFERVAGEKDRVIVYALLNGPSLTGAYRIDCMKDGAVSTDVSCALYPRKTIARLGVAPLTSMFWYSETNRLQGVDWRPEIHDSDGLAIWTGGGERIWRPLNNPPRVITNSFVDQSPKGFGLLQRDREFAHYQDDGVFYHRRPSVWVEPLGEWGPGVLQLVEIPTDDEIHDNIVTYWVPDGEVGPGRRLDFSYRIHWRAEEPFPMRLGRVTDSFRGTGGIPGQPRPAGVVRFVVDFEGSELIGLKRGEVEPVVSLSRGTSGLKDAYPVVGKPGIIRAFFEVEATGADPVDMRLYVRSTGTGEALTETWLYQLFPAAPGQG